jgi:hypothetical protein
MNRDLSQETRHCVPGQPMSIVLPALAVAFAACCVWLAVRVFSRRDKLANWLAILVFVEAVAAYPLSSGPVIFLCMAFNRPDWAQSVLDVVYLPLDDALRGGPQWLWSAMLQYRYWWYKCGFML